MNNNNKRREKKKKIWGTDSQYTSWYLPIWHSIALSISLLDLANTFSAYQFCNTSATLLGIELRWKLASELSISNLRIRSFFWGKRRIKTWGSFHIYPVSVGEIATGICYSDKIWYSVKSLGLCTTVNLNAWRLLT